MFEKRDSFVFYRSFYEAIKELPRDVQGEVLTAIMEYSLNGETTENLKPVAKAIFTLIKPQIDANNRRFINGSKGGRPPKEKTETKPNNNLNETKPKPNVNVNELPKGNNDLTVNWDGLIKQFNEITGKKIRLVNQKAKGQIKARLKEGYTKEDLLTAIENCYKDKFHMENNHQHLTLEFISRPDKLERYSTMKPDKPIAI